ncbi:MAG TPA: hypothetical protein DCP32_00900 [Anaerolineaceae bacterium]|nr:hypothetical protein [Anaerolineaceae bacterium]
MIPVPLQKIRLVSKDAGIETQYQIVSDNPGPCHNPAHRIHLTSALGCSEVKAGLAQKDRQGNQNYEKGSSQDANPFQVFDYIRVIGFELRGTGSAGGSDGGFHRRFNFWLTDRHTSFLFLCHVSLLLE